MIAAALGSSCGLPRPDICDALTDDLAITARPKKTVAARLGLVQPQEWSTEDLVPQDREYEQAEDHTHVLDLAPLFAQTFVKVA